MQVKKFVAEVNGPHGFRWRVFTTGSDRHYMFVCAQNANFQQPVLKSRLTRKTRSALANGWGRAG
jgi:hypothetical protein